MQLSMESRVEVCLRTSFPVNILLNTCRKYKAWTTITRQGHTHIATSWTPTLKPSHRGSRTQAGSAPAKDLLTLPVQCIRMTLTVPIASVSTPNKSRSLTDIWTRSARTMQITKQRRIGTPSGQCSSIRTQSTGKTLTTISRRKRTSAPN